MLVVSRCSTGVFGNFRYRLVRRFAEDLFSARAPARFPSASLTKEVPQMSRRMILLALSACLAAVSARADNCQPSPCGPATAEPCAPLPHSMWNKRSCAPRG